jgi:DNA-binding NtrC family response regulator
LADVSWLFDELQPKPEIVEQNSHVEPPVISTSSSAPLAGISLDQLERRAIIDTLKQTNGNQLMAAKTLGISDRTLRDKIKRYRQQGSLQPV